MNSIYVRLYSSALFLLFNYETLWGQATFDNMPSIPGKCFASCLVPDLFQYWEETFPIYTRTYNDSTEFIRKINLETDDLGRIELVVVRDTLKIKDYQWKKYKYKELVKKGGYSEWRGIVCVEKRTRKLNKKIQSKLIDLGLGVNLGKTGIVGVQWKKVMKDYQQSIGIIGLGFYDIETLKALGIKTKKL